MKVEVGHIKGKSVNRYSNLGVVIKAAHIWAQKRKRRNNLRPRLKEGRIVIKRKVEWSWTQLLELYRMKLIGEVIEVACKGGKGV